MSWYPDLSNRTMVAVGDHVRAVGWLSAQQPFAKGEVPIEFISRLHEFVRLSGASGEALYFPASGGVHTCEICEHYRDSRDFGVPSGPILYVAPGMITHYVERHEYCPPDEFVRAVLESPFPDTPEYRVAAKPFYDMHERWWKQVHAGI
jgi:hypothetical protein